MFWFIASILLFCTVCSVATLRSTMKTSRNIKNLAVKGQEGLKHL